MALPIDESSNPAAGAEWRPLFRVGAVAAIAVLALVPVQLVVFVTWPLPKTVLEWFALLESHPLVGLVDLDLLMAVDTALIGVMFLALWAALRRANESFMAIALLLEVIAIATYFSSNVAFEMRTLSLQYAAAETEAEQAAAVAAGQAMIASWQGSAFNISYVLTALTTLVTSLVMLRSHVFGRPTAYVGVAFGILSIIPASAGTVGLVVSLLSLIPMWLWIAMVARRLLQLGRGMPMEISRRRAGVSARRQQLQPQH